jgi:xanthine dehydrogenase YagR molybdenum-binding subunit
MTNQPLAFPAIGRPLPRAEGRLKVTGGATYAAEWPVPDLAYGAVVDSAVSNGRIRRIDASRALAAPGVIAVVTHENAPRLAPYPETGAGFQLPGDGGLGEALQPLQGPDIYYGGQSVAVVVANTSEQALYAATLVQIEYDAHAPDVDFARGGDRVGPESFAGAETLQKDIGDAMVGAPIVLARKFETAPNHHNPIELLCSTAIWSAESGDDQLLIYDASRAVDMLRGVVAQSFGLPEANVRVVSKYIGGAFGSKAWSFHVPMLAALAARSAGRSVRIEWRRQQVFTVGGHRPATQHSVTLGATREGRLQAIQHDGSAATSRVCGYVEYASRETRMMYDAPVGFTNELVHLNLPSPSVMRGPGFLMGGWALESTMDELARELDLDPVELRLINHADINPDDGLPFSSKHLRECYAQGKALFGWDERPRVAPASTGHTVAGYGMASCMHPAARVEANARATLFADGRAVVRAATHELGNGAYTIFRQIAADGLGLPIERVAFELGDSDYPAAPPTHGSLTTATIGPPVLDAARNVVKALIELAVRQPASPLHGAEVGAVGASEGRLHLQADSQVGEDYASVIQRAGLAHVVASGKAAPGDEQTKFAFYSFGAVFAEVRVDRQTGVVRVARLCGAYDIGRVMNPLTARSQLMGGMIFALGATLMEEGLFDPNTGLAVVRNLADYHVPCCADTPEIDIDILDIPDPNISELGARGCGEMGTNGVPAAICNAIFDAVGVRPRSLPVTPDKIMEALG